MVNGVSAIRGDLVKWAREQHQQTMRQVQARGGPSPAYQSEVENGKKKEVSTSVLNNWTRILRITSAFARGELPRYRSDRAQCRGLAGKVGALIGQSGEREIWVERRPLERAQRVLHLIGEQCPNLPRVVLAYVMGIQLQALEEMIAGDADIDHNHLRIIAELTTLPEDFFRSGILEEPDEVELVQRYLPAIRLANKARISPAALIQFINRQPSDSPPSDSPPSDERKKKPKR